MLNTVFSLLPSGVAVDRLLPVGNHLVLEMHVTSPSAPCPLCDRPSARLHSHYRRRLADLPWQGRTVELRVRVRRFRCATATCLRRIFVERLPTVAIPKARRTCRLHDTQQSLALALGGAPGSRLADKLAMPVSGATLLRMIRSIVIEEPSTPRVLGVDEWAWRKGQTYGTILCDLELGHVVDLLPDRNAGSFAAWLRRHPGVEIVVRDRGGLYADGARQGAPAARQSADRWHLLRNLGDAVRTAVDRHRAAVRSAAREVAGSLAEHHGSQDTKPTSEQTHLTAKRNARQDLYREMCRLHTEGMTISAIARALAVSRQKAERWLKSGGPATHDKPAQPKLLDSWSGILEQRWNEGCRNGTRLWRELRDQGAPVSVTTVKRWATARRLRGAGTPEVVAATTAGRWQAPSSRRCARLLTTAPEKLDADERRFIEHLGQTAPGLIQAAVVANAFTKMVRDHHDTGFEAWLEAARASELRSFADGIDRDAAAVRAALTEPWSTSPVEGHINRVKTIKRQMYGRANYDLLRQRVLAAA